MNRWSGLVRQAFRHIWREKRLTLGSFLVLTIALILIDLFWLASLTINDQYRIILKQVKMEVFLTNALPDSLTPVVRAGIVALDEVDSAVYLSKAAAAEIFEREFGPHLLDQLETNPLPRSFVVFFKRTLNLAELESLERSIMGLEGVGAVEFGRSWIEKVERFGQTLKMIGYIVGGLILFVVLLTMANTNRLTARGKIRDFIQLKLLGAGPEYWLLPFLSEGFLSAAVAAVLGWVIILYASTRMTFAAFSLIFPRTGEIVLFCLAAGLTGLAGAYLGIRRFVVK